MGMSTEDGSVKFFVGKRTSYIFQWKRDSQCQISANSLAENTPNTSNNFSPICLPVPESFEFLKKSSLWMSVVRGHEHQVSRLYRTLRSKPRFKSGLQFTYLPTVFPPVVSVETILFWICKMQLILILAANSNFLPKKLNLCCGNYSSAETIHGNMVHLSK